MMLFSSALAVVLAMAPVQAPDASIVGSWEGRITAQGRSIRVVFRVAGDGTTVMDSPDQGARGIPAEAPVIEAGHVRISVPALGGRFEGRLSPDGATLSGALHQGGVSAPIVLARRAVSPLAGVWEGPIVVAGRSIRIVFRVGPDGEAVMDSPDQGARGIPVEGPVLDGREVRFVAPSIGGKVEGRLAEDGRTIEAVLRQGAADLPLILTRTAETAEMESGRPQTPRPPFPYRSEDVAFDNAAAPGVRLAGTLTLPEGEGPFPAAILITGTGPQDRDETILGHKPFAVWADALTRRGVAVLRFDDRGVGRSTGSFGAAAQADFGSDVLAAFNWLAARAEIDPGRIGLIGHSEGATFAQLAMQQGADPAWLVALAGVALPGGEVIVDQVRRMAEAAGLAPDAVERNVALQRQLMKAVADNASDPEAVRREVQALLEASGRTPQEAAAAAATMAGDWYRSMVVHDPAASISAIRAPMLAVFGEKDVQVSPEANAPALLRHKPDAEVVVLPGLNHLFQPAQTGLPAEYEQIQTTLDPSAIQQVVDWVAARSAGEGRDPG